MGSVGAALALVQAEDCNCVLQVEAVVDFLLRAGKARSFIEATFGGWVLLQAVVRKRNVKACFQVVLGRALEE